MQNLSPINFLFPFTIIHFDEVVSAMFNLSANSQKKNKFLTINKV